MAPVTKKVLQTNNLSIMKLSTETLAKANVLTHKQMSKIYGGECYLRCDQRVKFDISGNQIHDENYNTAVAAGNGFAGNVDDCDRATVGVSCGSLNHAVCVCNGMVSGSLDTNGK